MDFLNKALAQLRDLFGTMSPAARITTGLLLAVVIVSLCYLFQFETDNADDFLFSAEPLTQREMAVMTGALGQAGLNDYEVEGQRLRVPRSQRADYMAALYTANALPENPGSAAEEVFRSNNPLEPRDVRESKTRRATERDLESTIRKLRGVDEAYVFIEEMEKKGFPPRKERRAAVSVLGNGNSYLDDHLIRTVRHAVAFGGGVENDNVTVVDLNAGISYEGHGPDSKSFGEENAYAEALKRYERLYREKIVEHLSMIPGARINVFVELDKKLATRTTTRKIDGQAVPIRSFEHQKDTSSNTPLNQGRPGAASNNVGNSPQAVATAASSESTLSETWNEQDSLASMTQDIFEEVGLVPTYVKAAISVPRSYFRRVWQQENPTTPGEDPTEPDRTALKAIETQVIQDVKDWVAALLPEPAPGVDKFPRITVKAYTETPIASPPGPSVAETASSWFYANWKTMGMFGMALVGIVMLRGMLKAAPSGGAVAVDSNFAVTLPINTSVEPSSEEAFDDENDENGNSLKARFQHSGRSLRDELSELVKEDLDAAANVLQNWIGDAA
jgi:flagellar M-ring protein FliF